MMVVMMVMVMMVIPAPSRRYHDDARSISTPAVMVMMMMVVLTDKELRYLRVFVRGRGGRRFIYRLQQGRGIRNRLKQVRERIRPQHLARGRTWRSLSGIERPQRRYRS